MSPWMAPLLLMVVPPLVPARRSMAWAVLTHHRVGRGFCGVVSARMLPALLMVLTVPEASMIAMPVLDKRRLGGGDVGVGRDGGGR